MGFSAGLRVNQPSVSLVNTVKENPQKQKKQVEQQTHAMSSQKAGNSESNKEERRLGGRILGLVEGDDGLQLARVFH